MARNRTRAEGEILVQQYRQSGLKPGEFAKKAGITRCSLQWWCRQLKSKKRSKARPVAGDGFVEVKAAKGAVAFEAGLHIEIGSARLVFSKLPDAVWLATFAARLRGHQ